MNKINIQQHLQKIINIWVSSLIISKQTYDKDEKYQLYIAKQEAELIDKFKKSIIISGGSITSLFLDEDVNDYDIYFTDISIVNFIRNYYLNCFNNWNQTNWYWSDKYQCLYTYKHENYKFLDKTELYNNWEKYVHVVDAITSEHISNKEEEFNPICITPNAISLTNNIQLITRFTGNINEILSNFDFIHTNNYYSYFENKLYTNKESLESILSKQLIYNGSKYPICSLIRTRKFIQRGWNISAGEYLKMAFQIKSLDLYDLNVLREQLIGVDAKYFIKFLEKIKDIESFNEIDIFSLLTEIFEEVGD